MHSLHKLPFDGHITLCKGLGLLCLSLLTLAGCTTGKNRVTAANTAGSNADAKTLRIALNNDIDSLDPAKTADIGTFEVLLCAFEPLLNYDANNQLVPVLAEHWEVSKDGKTYTFHLRKDVTFHNGQPFTAADVKYSLERALARKTKSPLATAYLDGIVGKQEVVDGKRDDLPGIVIVDPLTVTITLDKPRAYFLGMLTQQTGFIICKAAVEKNNGVVDEKAFVGTGPFTFDTYLPGQRILLKAYPGYWGGKPALERVEFPIFLEADTAYANYETGNLDISFSTLAHYSEDRKTGKFSADYHLLPTAQFPRFVMNSYKQPLFAKKEVRLAFAMAIDRANILNVAFRGVGTRRNGALSPGVPGAEPSPPEVPYDPKKAKELLAQAGYPDGKGFPSLTLTIPSKAAAQASAAELVRANLRDNLGLAVTIQEREAVQMQEESRRKALEMYFTNWIDYPDPHAFLSSQFISNSDQNYSGYKNPEFDTLCQQADAELDPAKRAALYARANHLLIDDVGVLPTIETPRVILIRPNIKGWQANLISLLPNPHVTKVLP